MKEKQCKMFYMSTTQSDICNIHAKLIQLYSQYRMIIQYMKQENTYFFFWSCYDFIRVNRKEIETGNEEKDR